MNTKSHNDWEPTDLADTPLAQWTAQPFTLWMQGWAQFQAESIRFVADRAAKDLGMARRLRACATPAEALGVGMAFAFEAARDYLGESQRLLALAAGDFENATAAVV